MNTTQLGILRHSLGLREAFEAFHSFRMQPATERDCFDSSRMQPATRPGLMDRRAGLGRWCEQADAPPTPRPAGYTET
jgi:hypothetical protein